MADADARQLRSKERPGEAHEAAAKRRRWDVSEGRMAHGAARFTTLPTQRPEVRPEKEVIFAKTKLTELIRKKKKKNPQV